MNGPEELWGAAFIEGAIACRNDPDDPTYPHPRGKHYVDLVEEFCWYLGWAFTEQEARETRIA